MTLPSVHRVSYFGAALAFSALSVATCFAQQPMGTVATREARVSGGLEVQGEQARLLTNASVTAYSHTATVALDRGGEVLVCSTSQFHLLHSGSAGSLLFGLDRGALELRSASSPQDIVLTPDLRFTLVTAGPLDLRLRVTPEGDTCVDNAGANAPVLVAAEAFSKVTYRVLPEQHLLFEHGSVRQVVDREKSWCGCPPATPAVTVAVAPPGQIASPAQAEAEHPFPVAVSEGLAPAEGFVNSAPAGEKGTQVVATLSYSRTEAGNGANQVAVAVRPALTAVTAPPPAPPGAHDLVHAMSRMFRRIFHRGAAAR